MANTFHMRVVDGSIIKFEAHKTIDSVSNLAKEYAKCGYPDRFVVFSEAQKANDTNENIRGVYMSLILRPSMFPSQVGFLNALSSVALLSALEEYTDKELGISWVSDIYCGGEYVGGVNIEGRLDNFTSYEYIIISFAVRLDESNFPPRLKDLVKKVFESENASVSTIIAKDILTKFFSLYPKLKTPDKFMETYKEKFILRGKTVKYIENNRRRSCKVLNVDGTDGRLIVESKRGEIIKISSPKSLIIPRKFK